MASITNQPSEGDFQLFLSSPATYLQGDLDSKISHLSTILQDPQIHPAASEEFYIQIAALPQDQLKAALPVAIKVFLLKFDLSSTPSLVNLCLQIATSMGNDNDKAAFLSHLRTLAKHSKIGQEANVLETYTNGIPRYYGEPESIHFQRIAPFLPSEEDPDQWRLDTRLQCLLECIRRLRNLNQTENLSDLEMLFKACRTPNLIQTGLDQIEVLQYITNCESDSRIDLALSCVPYIVNVSMTPKKRLELLKTIRFWPDQLNHVISIIESLAKFNIPKQELVPLISHLMAPWAGKREEVEFLLKAYSNHWSLASLEAIVRIPSFLLKLTNSGQQSLVKDLFYRNFSETLLKAILQDEKAARYYQKHPKDIANFFTSKTGFSDEEKIVFLSFEPYLKFGSDFDFGHLDSFELFLAPFLSVLDTSSPSVRYEFIHRCKDIWQELNPNGEWYSNLNSLDALKDFLNKIAETENSECQLIANGLLFLIYECQIEDLNFFQNQIITLFDEPYTDHSFFMAMQSLSSMHLVASTVDEKIALFRIMMTCEEDFDDYAIIPNVMAHLQGENVPPDHIQQFIKVLCDLIQFNAPEEQQSPCSELLFEFSEHLTPRGVELFKKMGPFCLRMKEEGKEALLLELAKGKFSPELARAILDDPEASLVLHENPHLVENFNQLSIEEQIALLPFYMSFLTDDEFRSFVAQGLNESKLKGDRNLELKFTLLWDITFLIIWEKDLNNRKNYVLFIERLLQQLDDTQKNELLINLHGFDQEFIDDELARRDIMDLILNKMEQDMLVIIPSLKFAVDFIEITDSSLMVMDAMKLPLEHVKMLFSIAQWCVNKLPNVNRLLFVGYFFQFTYEQQKVIHSMLGKLTTPESIQMFFDLRFFIKSLLQNGQESLVGDLLIGNFTAELVQAIVNNAIAAHYFYAHPDIITTYIDAKGGFDALPHQEQLNLLPFAPPDKVKELVESVPQEQRDPSLSMMLESFYTETGMHYNANLPDISDAFVPDIERFLKKIPLLSLALVTQDANLRQWILPYLKLMNDQQLAVVIPQLDSKAFITQMDQFKAGFGVEMLKNATLEQRSAFLNHLSANKKAVAGFNLEYLKLGLLKGVTDHAFKQKVDDFFANIEQSQQASAVQPTHHIPPFFLCPITGQIMEDPVKVIPTGKVYEREAIEVWLNAHGRDPLTRIPATTADLVPQPQIKAHIVRWQRKHPPPFPKI